MANEINALREILLSVVNDLEKTAAELTVSTMRLQKLAPISALDHQDGLRSAVKENAGFYEELRKKIQAISGNAQ